MPCKFEIHFKFDILIYKIIKFFFSFKNLKNGINLLKKEEKGINLAFSG